MRIDKFINSVNIVKRRSIAQDMIENGVVFVENRAVKSSRDIKIGDVIEIRYLDETKRYEVLKIPEGKTIPKSKKDEYVKTL